MDSHLEMFTKEFWDERYRGHEALWSREPNLQLVSYAGDLKPGRALDVGCGEGADAIWLAQNGWTVTGIDVSPVALERARANALAAGDEVARAVEFRDADLFGEDWTPLGGYAIVSAQYLHLPPEVRGRAMGRLAEAVRPGGHLLVVTHHPSDLEIPGLRPNLPELFSTADELGAHLDRGDWEIVAAAAPERASRTPDGAPVTIHDAVLFAHRVAGVH